MKKKQQTFSPETSLKKKLNQTKQTIIFEHIIFFFLHKNCCVIKYIATEITTDKQHV